MSLAVFNINDAGIQVSVEGELMRTSPGYAVLDGSTLLTGEKASQAAKLLPRWTNTRFWSQLDTNPVASQTDNIRHHADLAFAHLEDLWLPIRDKVEQVIYVVPGYYNNSHLGLLLGMSRECGVPVQGIVDQSVVAASNLPLHGKVLHLDIHLHAITLSVLTNDGTVARREVTTVLESGLFTLWDRWANILANQFIQTTRFDPMHDAASEQQLFDRLPQWISELGASGMHAFSLSTDPRTPQAAEQSITVSNDSLLKACTPLYPQIVQAIRAQVTADEPATVLLSHRFQGFPGLKDSLRLIKNLEIIDLAELKAVGSAALHSDKIITPGESVNHVVQLDTGDTTSQTSPVVSAPTRPTHLLWQHQALPIGSGFAIDADLTNGPRRSQSPACAVYPRSGELLLEPGKTIDISLNGNLLSAATALTPGDIIGISGENITLIAVSKDG